MYLDAINLYGWAMPEKLPISGFKWVKNLSEFNGNFIKNHDENSDIAYFLEVDAEYPKKLFNLHKDLPFLPERRELFVLHEDSSSLLERKKNRKSKKACL